MSKKEFDRLSDIAFWYLAEADRCQSEGNKIGERFWHIMGTLTAYEIGIV